MRLGLTQQEMLDQQNAGFTTPDDSSSTASYTPPAASTSPGFDWGSLFSTASQFVTKLAVPVYAARQQASTQKSQQDYQYKMAQLQIQQRQLNPSPTTIRGGLPQFYSQGAQSSSSSALIPVLLLAGAGLVAFLIIK